MRAALSALVATLLLTTPTHATTPIGQCGMTVAGDGELTTDLDCTGSDSPAVTITKGSLALNGFTITGGPIGVKCLGKCRITGPGKIAKTDHGIDAYGKLEAIQVDVDQSAYIGIQCFTSCRVTGGSLTNSGNPWNPIVANGEGVRSTIKLTLDGVTITNNGIGAIARSYPKHHGKLLARNVTIVGNGIGAVADASAKITDSSVTDNITAGLVIGDFLYEDPCPDRPRFVKLTNTTVTRNGGTDGCGTTRACADLLTCTHPKLDALSTCDTSYVQGSVLPGSDWDVCSGD